MGNDRTQVILEVGGMACAFCASTIEEGLSKVNGVDSVKVIMNTSEVVVRYDPKKLDNNSVKKHLTRLGYYAFDESEKSYSGIKVLKDSRRRALGAAAITAPIAILAYLSSMLGILHLGLDFKILEMVTSGIVLFYFGLPIHIGAFNALRRRILNEHVLYGAAGFAAYAAGLMSFVSTSTADFFNAAALLTTFHLAAGWYGAKVRSDTTNSLRKILNLQPPTARIVNEAGKVEHERIVPLSEVKVSNLILVKGGEKIPVDGQIESGESTVSEAILTGESEPVHKKHGDSVLAGSTNGDGVLVIRTIKVGSETMLMRVAGNVKQIQEEKPFLMTIFDKVIDKYVLAVLVLAGVTAAGWIIFNLMSGTNLWVQTVFATLAVLVIGYPCAIGLSTPPVKLRAISIAADKGVLVNDASAFLPITKADTIVLDKTGTITEGKPTVSQIITFDNSNEELLLEHAASIELGSSHPISKAIVEEAKKRGLNPNPALDTKQVAGKGVKGSYNNYSVIVGTEQFLEEQDVNVPEGLQEKIESIDSPVLVSFDGKLEGVLGISDAMRKGVVSRIRNLIQRGYNVIMLTGDTKKAAEKIASKLGIQFEARMSPMEKASYVKNLQKENKTVIAVGDGVNDAPTLAQADAGMAVGSGIDISKETASFVLLTNDIGIIPTLVRLGRRYVGTTKRNIFLALGFNAVGIPIAAIGLLNPFIAMTIMVVDVAVVFASTWFLRSADIVTLNDQNINV